MPASPARIGFIQSEFRRAVATTPDAAVRFGNLARESDDPIETWFDDVEDAQAVAEERQALLSAERRRFRCVTVGVNEVMALTYIGSLPVAQFVDRERGFDGKAVVSEIVIDMEKGQAALSVWG